MQGLPDKPTGVKRIGDLLVEAGYVSPPDLERALEMGKKNFQALGRVLVTLKLATDQDINDALAVQKCCKHEGLPGHLAVKALILKKSDNLSVPEALQHLGWTADGYKSYDEPASIVNAKAELQTAASGGKETRDYAEALIKVADAYLANKLPGRAEVFLNEAGTIGDLTGDTLKPVLLRKLSRVATAQKRFNESRQYLEKAHEHLVKSGNTNTEEFATFLLEFADFNESRRKLQDAERFFIEAASIFARLGFDDERILQAIKRASAAGQQLTRVPDQIKVGELLTGSGVATDVQIDFALSYATEQGVPLGRALVTLKILQENHLYLVMQVQLLIRNGELSPALGKLIVQYGVRFNADLDKVLKLFDYRPKSQDQLADELKKASEKMVSLERSLPADHADIAAAYGTVAYLYFQRQQWAEAEQLFKRGMLILERAQSGSAGQAADFLDLFAELRTAQLDFDDAVRLQKLSTQLRAKQDGQISNSVARSMERLATSFCGKGDHASSVNCLDKALLIREKIYGADSHELINTLETKADCNIHRCDWEASQKILLRAHELCNENTPGTDERSRRIVEKLINVCKTTGDVGLIEQLQNSVKRIGFMV